ATEFTIQTSVPSKHAKDPESEMKDRAIKQVGSLADVMQYPELIPNDVPVYPNATEKGTTKPMKWREFSSKDSVKTIASWYDEKMKDNGWEFYHDTSEMGDSMKIYEKTDTDGIKRHIGVRVNDLKDRRNLTL